MLSPSTPGQVVPDSYMPPMPGHGFNRVQRDGDITLATAQGIYNQELFDLNGNNDLIGLSLRGSYNPFLDLVGFETSAVHRVQEYFITYDAAAGAAAGLPTSGVVTDPCADGETVESGGVSYLLQGFGRLRRSSPSRDITDIGIRYSENQPIYRIDGSIIQNDAEWDLVRLSSVNLREFQRLYITGNASVAGEADGLQQLVNYGYTDPITGDAATAMDSIVVDYNGMAMLPTGGATGVTVNGVLATDGYVLIDYIKSFIRRTLQRIQNSTLTGAPVFASILPLEHLSCLIDAYVCYTTCGGDIERMDSFEARTKLETLKGRLGGGGTVPLDFDGTTVLFYPYDHSLLTSATLGDIYLGVVRVGNRPLIRTQIKDMIAGARELGVTDRFMVTDNNRMLNWKTFDHTCFRQHNEMQWRVKLDAPWAWMRIQDVACGNILGAFSGDPLSAYFYESNLVAYAKA